MLDNPYVRVTVNFLHDMATGTWAACLLVLLVLRSQLAGLPQDAATAIARSMDAVFLLLLAALVVIVATGSVRLLYWRRATAPEDVAAKRRALLVKHAAFAVIYGGGTMWALALLP